MAKFKVTVEKLERFSAVVEVEADGPVAAQEDVDRQIKSGSLEASTLNWDDPTLEDGTFQTTGDIEGE